jgi:hypothetical protein
MAETYGEHQEAASAALNRLLVDDAPPTDPVDVAQLLHCREVVVDALRQRLYALGFNTHYSPTTVPEPPRRVPLRDLEKNLATLVDRMAFEVPTLRLEEGRRPVSEVLTRVSPDPTVELWRHAAIELLAGSHALDAAVERPWLRDEGAGWYLMRDVAVAMEAVLVLDSRLDEVGLLQEHQRPEAALGLGEQRMIASQCARVATWYATSDTPDRATPDVPGPREVAGPVLTVSGPAELADAQRRLARYLRPTHGNDAHFSGAPEIDTSTARMVVASQVFLTKQFELMALRTPGGEGLGAEFASRREILEDIQTGMARLVDLDDRGRNMRASWQQGELTTSLRRSQRRGDDLRLTPTQLLDLANATHEVTHNAAKALRRELLRETSSLRIADPTGQVGHTRVYRKHPLERALTDLINLPAPQSRSTPVRCSGPH